MAGRAGPREATGEQVASPSASSCLTLLPMGFA